MASIKTQKEPGVATAGGALLELKRSTNSLSVGHLELQGGPALEDGGDGGLAADKEVGAISVGASELLDLQRGR